MMATVWTRLLVLGAVAAVTHGLTCIQCPVGVFGNCLFPNEVVCDNSTLNCYSGDAQFNITGDFKLHNRGCLDSDLCGKTLTGSILGAGYTSSFTCCQTDLCNGATAPQLPLAAVCCAAAMLATLWAR
ncbi:unnamed protein product [Merluccius merluccius]